MSVTIGDATFSRLKAQPFGYNEFETEAGLTARRWLVTGLMTPAEWLTLTNAYNNWRDLRIQDPDTEESEVVGATISLSANGPGGQSWNAVPCWFSQAPGALPAGAWLLASVELVHAAERLQVILRQRDDQQADGTNEEDLPDLGTITLGSAVLKLLKPPDTYGAGPQLQLTAGGVHYITGPLVVEKIRRVEGVGSAADWVAVRAWYESQIVSRPGAGSWFPISPPSATARVELIDGVKVDRYTVSVQLGTVI